MEVNSSNENLSICTTYFSLTCNAQGHVHSPPHIVLKSKRTYQLVVNCLTEKQINLCPMISRGSERERESSMYT